MSAVRLRRPLDAERGHAHDDAPGPGSVRRARRSAGGPRARCSHRSACGRRLPHRPSPPRLRPLRSLPVLPSPRGARGRGHRAAAPDAGARPHPAPRTRGGRAGRTGRGSTSGAEMAVPHDVRDRRLVPLRLRSRSRPRARRPVRPRRRPRAGPRRLPQAGRPRTRRPGHRRSRRWRASWPTAWKPSSRFPKTDLPVGELFARDGARPVDARDVRRPVRLSRTRVHRERGGGRPAGRLVRTPR